MPLIDKLPLRKRDLIDSVTGQLKFLCQIEYSRYRSPVNFIVNLLGGLIAYALRPNNPPTQ